MTSTFHLSVRQPRVIFILLNSLGQKVYESRLEEGENDVDVSSFDPGIYYVRIKGENYFETIRVVKQ